MFLNRLSCRAVTSAGRFTTSLRCMSSKQDSGNDDSGNGSDTGWKESKWNVGVPTDWDGIKIDKDSRKLRPPDPINPYVRTVKILKNDMRNLPNYLGLRPPDDRDYIFPHHCDILIIGGGAVGSSCAYWLKEKVGPNLRIVVAEKDSSYKNAATSFSVGELHQQFSLEENIQMTLYAAEFFRKSRELLGEHVNLNYVPSGYLSLATGEQADLLHKNAVLQNRLGAKNITMTPRRLKERFPWLNVNGIELGCYGMENEGWFDPWALLLALKHKAQSFGAEYLDGELVNFEMTAHSNIEMIGVEEGKYEHPQKAYIKMNTGEIKDITFSLCIVAAGADTPGLEDILKIGKYGSGMKSVPLPLLPRRRHYYVVKMDGGRPIGLNVPQINDTANLYFRLNGLTDNILVEKSSDVLENYDGGDVPSDKQFFEEHIREQLENRVPAFKKCTIETAASGFYEYCTFDENGIIGPHPAYHSIYLATGFNGHGIQMAPAIGRAISELILTGEFMTIDLTRLGLDRFMVREPMYEENIVK